MNSQSKAGAAPDANQTAAPHKPARADSRPLYPKPDPECNRGNSQVDVESIVAAFGISVRRFDFDAHLPEVAKGHLCGWCVTLQNQRQTMYLNTAMSESVQRLTAGHELRHALEYRSGYRQDNLIDTPAEEKRCDRFSRELLMPLDLLLLAIAEVGTDTERLAEMFNVDAYQVKLRLKGLGLGKTSPIRNPRE